jgi:hypothetical protein
MARSRFWAVAFAFLVVMMFATLPSPLYGLYRTRDHLSAFTITVVFAIFAGGTITTLLAERSIAARFGRRGAMLGGVEGAARAADRAPGYRGGDRSGRWRRDSVPDRAAAAR